MAHLLLTLIYVLIATVQSQKEAICIWGRRGFIGKTINGLYRLATDANGPILANGAPYWKLDRSDQDCGDKYYWLFWYGTDLGTQAWYIGTSGTADFNFRIDSPLAGKCLEPTAIQTQDPTFCGPKWAVMAPFTIADPNVTASEGPCPTLNCGEIVVTDGVNQPASCLGTFLQTGDNHYTRDATLRTWWFNEPFFAWQCNSVPNSEQTCDTTKTNAALIQYAPPMEWQGIGDWTLQNVVGCPSCGTTVTFTCGNQAGYTTTAYLPTSPNPTEALIPTIKPTFATDAPSTDPTRSPGSGPLPDPTTTPTDPTTRAPSVPTVDPADDGSGGGGGGGGGDGDGDSMIAGLDDMWLWIIIIILIIILCCCCFCCLYFLHRKRKKENANQYFGDQEDENL